jgi:hypothetical protein
MAWGTIAHRPVKLCILNFDVCVNVKKCRSGRASTIMMPKQAKKGGICYESSGKKVEKSRLTFFLKAAEPGCEN